MDDSRSEFEREVLADLRFLKRVVYGLATAVGVAVLASVVLGVIGLVASFGGGSGAAGAGMDVHAPFTPGVTIETKTESGRTVRATITEFTWGQGPVFTARITGGEPRSLAADAWTFVLQDGTVLALDRLDAGPQTYVFALRGSLPGGSSVRFIHFNPDDSHGDIYFDVK